MDIEFTGKNISDAVRNATKALEKDVSELEYEIIDRGGLFRDAKIKVFQSIYFSPYKDVNSYEEYLLYDIELLSMKESQELSSGFDYNLFSEIVHVIENHPHTNIVEHGFEFYDDEENKYETGTLYYVGSRILIIRNGEAKSISSKSPFLKYDLKEITHLGKMSLFLDDDYYFRFSHEEDRNNLFRYVEEYNYFIDEMITSAKDKSLQIYSTLIQDSEITNAIQNFLNMVPEIVFVNINLYKTILHMFCFRSVITKDYLSFNESEEQSAIQILSDEDIQKSVLEIWEITKNLIALLMEHFSIDIYCVFLVTYLLINHGLINRYSKIWKESYDSEVDAVTWKSYLRKCVNENILVENDYKGIAALTYAIIQDDPNSNYIYRNQYASVLSELGEAIHEKRKKEFASALFQKTDIENKYFSIDDVDFMTGLEFESFICRLFQKMGYSAKKTQATGDQGIDILAERNGVKIGIQTKCYSGTVGNSAIQESVAGMNYYHCERAMVITNSRFTQAAIELANANNIILWDRNILKEKIESYKIENMVR